MAWPMATQIIDPDGLITWKVAGLDPVQRVGEHL